MLGFHVKDGLYFRRESDGRITVTATGPRVGDPEIYSTTFDQSAFASVVASMSARNETAETYQEALDYLTRAPKEDCGGAENAPQQAQASTTVSGGAGIFSSQ